jgi:uncharacterized MAPEG superfamily protein
MTVPFVCLAIVAFLPYVCAWVGGYLRHRQFGTLDNKNPRRQQAALEGAAARAHAAQLNAWEALPFFTAAVVVAHLSGASPGRVATLAVIFVATRILHPILYIADLDILRSLVFVVGFGCVVCLFLAAA